MLIRQSPYALVCVKFVPYIQTDESLLDPPLLHHLHQYRNRVYMLSAQWEVDIENERPPSIPAPAWPKPATTVAASAAPPLSTASQRTGTGSSDLHPDQEWINEDDDEADLVLDDIANEYEMDDNHAAFLGGWGADDTAIKLDLEPSTEALSLSSMNGCVVI